MPTPSSPEATQASPLPPKPPAAAPLTASLTQGQIAENLLPLANLFPGLIPYTVQNQPAAKTGSPQPMQMPDFEKLSLNMARLIEQGGKTLAAYFKPFETGEKLDDVSAEVADAVRSIGRVAEHWLSDPNRSAEAQTLLAKEFLSLWANTLRRLAGDTAPPLIPYDPSDKRFAAPEWRDSPYFDFLRQAHAIAGNWASQLVEGATELDPHTRDKARFYLSQISAALAPSNFLATNPELLRETLASCGENLVRGAANFANDVEAGGGTLKITQTDMSKFELGVNLAMTPGKVIFRNELIELIQYAPATHMVFKRPVVIFPPWINKFYILDLNPEKSFIRWAVEQGLTIFIVSWVNPDERHRDKDFEAYMREGVFAALEAIEKATGEKEVTAVGYCIGGTLLAMSLAYMAKTNDKRIPAAAFFTTQTDFSQAGDLRVFVDDAQLTAMERKLNQKGYLDARVMANSFNMLRPNDMIWSYFVNNYIKGNSPSAFDLLAWNADSTRMTAAGHMNYLRDCYLENKLSQGKVVLGGVPLDLKDITIPIYELAAREDHIAPARSVYIGAGLFGGEVRYVLAGSGHIAGVVNPPSKQKYQYWTGGKPAGTFDEWFSATTEHKGSWWPDWLAWLKAHQTTEIVPARIPGDRELSPLCDAPGEYVKVRY